MNPTKVTVANIPLALLQAMRPSQWIKNLFVYTALIFADMWSQVGLVTMAFALFCLVSGSVYLMNDVADREKDQHHPVKCKRPIASGRLPVPIAIAASVVFMVGGMAASFSLHRGFGAAVGAYLLLQIAYTSYLKHQPILDVFAIAAGFVIRAAAGGLVISVVVSTWLLVCTLLLALFLGFGKRRSEIVHLGENAGQHRPILSHYSLPLLDQMISIVLGGLVVCYAMYTISSPTAVKHPGLAITLPNVIYGAFRYLYLIHIQHKGGSPEKILMDDRPMQANMILWFAEVLLAFKLKGG